MLNLDSMCKDLNCTQEYFKLLRIICQVHNKYITITLSINNFKIVIYTYIKRSFVKYNPMQIIIES